MVGPVSIQALTWNMGNKPASQDAVNDVFGQLNGSPTVLSVSTQEELAPNGKRLVDLLKEKLEADGSQYEIIEAYHTTMAGANNSKKTLFKALLTDENRVSTAVLVKKPYHLQNAETRIDYQSNGGGKDENKKVNKSIITVQGKLTDSHGNSIMDISVSGGHFDANQDQKRRAHANKYLKNSGMKTTGRKSFDQIYEEASAFKIVTGDFNERNQLFVSGTKRKAVDMMKETNFKSYGFDVEKQPKMMQGTTQLSGTYGLNGIDDPDPKTQRKHVAKGGFLDRVAYTCGLKVKEGEHGFKVDTNYVKTNKKGKMFYHGSDHLPVLRSFNVTPPNTNPNSKAITVANHIQRRVPDFKDDIDHVNFLLNNKTKLMEAFGALPLQHHDSEYSPEQFIRIYAGVGQNATLAEVIKGLENKLTTLKDARASFDHINGKVSTAALLKPPDNQFLESVFNQLNKCHDLKNALQEINDLPEKKMSKEDKALFKQLAGKLVDDMYLCAGKRLNGEKANIPVNLHLSSLLQKYSNLPVVKKLSEAKDQVTASFQVNTFVVNTEQKLPQSRRQSAEAATELLPAQSFEPEPVARSSHFNVDVVKTLTNLYSSSKNSDRVQKKSSVPDIELDAPQSKNPKNK